MDGTNHNDHTIRPPAVDPARERRTRLAWAAVCAVVAALRVVLALITPAPEMGPDGLGYDDAARRLVGTGEYAWVYPGDYAPDPAPNAQYLPGYPIFLAGLYAIAGVDAPAQPLVSIVQALLSGLTLYGLALLGGRLGGIRGGWAALLLGAAYPPFWMAYRDVLTEDLFLGLCVWAAVALGVALSSRAPRSIVAYGAAGALIACAGYVRAAAIMWALLAVVLLLLTQPQHRGRLSRGFLVAALVIAISFAPWWYRNARIYDSFVPFSTITATGSLVATLESDAEKAEVYGSLAHGHLQPDEETPFNRRVAETARERVRMKLSEEPVGYIWRKARLFGISVLTYHPNPFGGFSGWGGAVEAIHLGLLALAAIGWWRSRRDALSLALLALPIALVAVHAPTLSFSRYFYPMMGFVVVMAGVGLQSLRPGRAR